MLTNNTMISLEEINRMFTAKINSGIFNPVKRHLTRCTDPEDRFQDALCMVWADYVSASLKGRPTDDAALVHGVRLRAKDITRRFAGGMGRRRDAMGDMAYQVDGVEVLRYDGLNAPENEDENMSSFVETITPGRLTESEEHINSAIDLDLWTRGLCANEQTVVYGKYAGLTEKEIGEKNGWSVIDTHRRAKELGLDLAIRSRITIR
jgi:hypothetical protein